MIPGDRLLTPVVGDFARKLRNERNEQYTIPDFIPGSDGPSKTKFIRLVQRIIHNSYLIHEHVIKKELRLARHPNE